MNIAITDVIIHNKSKYNSMLNIHPRTSVTSEASPIKFS